MSSTKLKRYAFDIFNKDHKLYIEGHRGVNKELYQNSIPSIKQAIKYDLDSIELDIWLSKDKIPIIFHGWKYGQLSLHCENVEDTNLTINSLTSEEIAQYELKENGQKIPTFNEVLDLCKNKIFINLEIKDPNINETFDQIIKLVEEKKMLNQIAISSFHHKYYDLVYKYNKEHNEKIEFGFLYCDQRDDIFVPYRFDTKGCTMNIYQGDVTKEIVKKAHENGIAVLCWFKMVDEENENIYKRLFDCDVDGICCNEPNKAKEFRDKLYEMNN
jgi:glycerophosphoryl diester phosphodiesterase